MSTTTTPTPPVSTTPKREETVEEMKKRLAQEMNEVEKQHSSSPMSNGTNVNATKSTFQATTQQSYTPPQPNTTNLTQTGGSIGQAPTPPASASPKYNPTPYIASEEHLPDFDNIRVYDYQKDLSQLNDNAKAIISSLADMYLGKNADIIKHNYIQGKIEEDARVYSSSLFLEKMSQKLLVDILTQIDNGDNSPKIYEVANQTMQQIRENVKDARKSRSEIEELYKGIRRDFGLTSTIDEEIDKSVEATDTSKTILNNRSLNQMIDQMIADRDAKKDPKG